MASVCASDRHTRKTCNALHRNVADVSPRPTFETLHRPTMPSTCICQLAQAGASAVLLSCPCIAVIKQEASSHTAGDMSRNASFLSSCPRLKFNSRTDGRWQLTVGAMLRGANSDSCRTELARGLPASQLSCSCVAAIKQYASSHTARRQQECPNPRTGSHWQITVDVMLRSTNSHSAVTNPRCLKLQFQVS
jgi:hypothetical protein